MSDVEESDIEDVDVDVDDAEEDIDENTDTKVAVKKPITVKKIALPEHVDSDEDDEEDDIDDEDDEEEDEDYDADVLEEQEFNAEQQGPGEVPGAVPGAVPIEEQQKPKKDQTNVLSPINSDVESDDEDFLQKFDAENRNEYVKKFHPECFTGNSVEIESLTKIVRDPINNIIIDDNHQTNPFLSKYEKTKSLGQRAKQLNLGHPPYITVPVNIIDGYLIAELELREKKIPVIIRRPLPGGKSEYWKLQDLELI